MSSRERHRRTRRFKVLCAACRERKARFRFRGEVRADRDHSLCFECYRGEINRARARRLREPAAWPTLSEPPAVVGTRALDARQIAHRQRMLSHLRRASPLAS
jgi:hypothetical protein